MTAGHTDRDGQPDRASARHLEQLINATPSIIYMLEARHDRLSVTFVSDDVRQRLAYSPEMLIEDHRWWQDAVHPHDAETAHRALQHWLRRGARGVLHRQYRLRTGTGEYRWLSDSLQRMPGAPPVQEGDPLLLIGSLSDITSSVSSAERLTKLSRVVPGMLYQYEEDTEGNGHFPYISEGCRDLFGLDPEQLSGEAHTLLDLVHAEDLQGFRDSIRRSASQLRRWRYEFRVHCDRNRKNCRWIFGHATPERLPSGGTLWHGYMADITRRKQLEDELAESRDILNRAQQIGRLGHWRTNLSTGEIEWSDLVFEIFGVDPATTTPDEALFRQLVHPEDLEEVSAALRRAYETGVHDVVHRIVRPDGTVRWVHELADLKRTDARQDYLIGTVRDITEQKELELQLRRQSVSDDLTGAWNRRFFVEQAEREFERFRRHGHWGSLVLFDFDHFKRINDQYGHAAGDQVLRLSSQAIQRRLRSTDILARIGGEEFAILLPATEAEQALVVAETVRREVAAQAFHVDDASFHATITCGVAAFLEEETSYEQTLQRADQALYEGKNGGRNRVVAAS